MIFWNMLKACWIVGCPIYKYWDNNDPRAIVAHLLVAFNCDKELLLNWYNTAWTEDKNTMRQRDIAKIIKLLWYNGCPDLEGTNL